MSEERLRAVGGAGLPGAVAVGPDFAETAGVAKIETGEPLTLEHRFRIGSVTKIFVGALVLQLVAEGTFNLDDDAGPLVQGVTIRQLLNHTSGLPDFQEDDMVAVFEPYREDPSYRWPLGPREQLALVLEKPRLFPPGAGWAYHGSNYLALGLLVEEATGSKLRDELRSRIFEPLGLEATDLVDGPLTGSRCARGYLPPDNPVLPGPGPVDVTELDLPFHWAGGGIVSTAGDVAAMLATLLGGDLLPGELRVEMLRAVESDWAETDRYGLGIGEISAVMGRERSRCGSLNLGARCRSVVSTPPLGAGARALARHGQSPDRPVPRRSRRGVAADRGGAPTVTVGRIDLDGWQAEARELRSDHTPGADPTVEEIVAFVKRAAQAPPM